MATEWLDVISSAKDDLVDLGKVYLSRTETPVATGQSGSAYVEGQPASVQSGGIKPAYLIAGGIGLAVLLFMFVAMRR